MYVKLLSVCTFMFVLAGCGGAGGSSSTAAVVDVCEANLEVPPGLCDCVGGASKELSASERGFVVASLKKDQKATEFARKELGFDELTRASMFFLTASQKCSASLPE